MADLSLWLRLHNRNYRRWANRRYMSRHNFRHVTGPWWKH